MSNRLVIVKGWSESLEKHLPGFKGFQDDIRCCYNCQHIVHEHEGESDCGHPSLPTYEEVVSADPAIAPHGAVSTTNHFLSICGLFKPKVNNDNKS